MKLSLSWLWIVALSLVGSLSNPTNVVLTSFTAEAGAHTVKVNWETASEVHNLGFYIWRSLEEMQNYTNISGFIPSQDEGAGAFYAYEDTDVTPGLTYYYRLLDVPDDGSFGEFTSAVTATVPLTTYIFLPAVYHGWPPPPIQN